MVCPVTQMKTKAILWSTGILSQICQRPFLMTTSTPQNSCTEDTGFSQSSPQLIPSQSSLSTSQLHIGSSGHKFLRNLPNTSILSSPAFCKGTFLMVIVTSVQLPPPRSHSLAKHRFMTPCSSCNLQKSLMRWFSHSSIPKIPPGSWQYTIPSVSSNWCELELSCNSGPSCSTWCRSALGSQSSMQ